VIYGCEGDLHSDLLAEILEDCTIKVPFVVDCDVVRDTITTNDILPEELFDVCGAYVCDRLHLNPLREIFDCHDGEGVIALCWS
jgi:hypothetical protein